MPYLIFLQYFSISIYVVKQIVDMCVYASIYAYMYVCVSARAQKYALALIRAIFRACIMFASFRRIKFTAI